MNANAAPNADANDAPNAAPNTDPNVIEVFFTSTLLTPIRLDEVWGMDATIRKYAPHLENNECKHDLHTRCMRTWATVRSSEGRQLSCPLCHAVQLGTLTKH